MHYLYKITNQLNQKNYIGQTVNIKNRWMAHKSYSKKPEKTGQYVHHAMAKYGINNFILEIIAICRTQEDANEIEMILINQYNSRNKKYGYNLAIGGNRSNHSEETKQKLRLATINQIKTNGHPALGTKRTPEQKANMSIIQQNIERIYTAELRQKLSDSHKGKKQSEETIVKRSNVIMAKNGDMTCHVIDCGTHDRRHNMNISGVWYCRKHAQRLVKTGSLELLPRKAHNKKQFTNEEITQILSDKRAAATVGKDFNVSERVILRIRREFKNI